MLRYFIKRLLGMIPTLIIVAVCVFFFIHLLPGDPARLAAGPEADEATVEMIRHSLGLDRSIPEQFVNFVVGACQGDFGTSIRSQRPVIQPDALAHAHFHGLVGDLRSGNRRDFRGLPQQVA
mgnify:CR=1 FL=1